MGKKRNETREVGNEKKANKKKSHLSALMMLGSQLLSSGRFNDGLPPFITKSLDFEQIWQQLELRNDHKMALPACTREVVQISSGRQRRKRKDKSQKQKGSKSKADSASDDHTQDQSHQSDEDSSEEGDDILNSIKKRLAEEPGKDKNDSLDDFSDSENEGDIDFDFKVDNEIVKRLSDEDEEGDDAYNLTSKVKKAKGHNRQPQTPGKKRSTVVDDKFFKLADMEQFLESEDMREEKRIKREKKSADDDDDDDDDDDESDEDDDEIDMFADMDSEEEGERGAKYNDFFDPPDDELNQEKNEKEDSIDDDHSENSDLDSENEDKEEKEGEEEQADENMDDDDENGSDNNILSDDNEGTSEEESGPKAETKSKKKVSFTTDLLQSDEETETPKEDESKGNKSSFEIKQEQLQARAREMEEMSLKEAPWELTGEASASKRPENSLLDTVLDFQHTTRAAPVISDETTKTLEDYIKQRIKDKTFDDVERKEKPKEDAFEFKKRIVLDQEKSKLSLGELYEQEFMKQQQQDKEEVKADPECEKIEKELHKLFHQLDALSNFRYTPMKPGTEVKILVNTPAITMEEVAPVATADSELLAPEEVHDKMKGDLKADEERSTTDKKRARRQKKKEKRERKQAKEAREKVVEKMKPGLGNKYSKAKALKQLEQLSKTDKNVTLIKGDSSKLKSSTSFFTQLQEETQTNVKAKKVLKEKRKKVVDASKLML